MLSVDGDTSTNDTVAVLASGLCGNEKITSENADYKAFTCALAAICEKLVKLMAKDGEGATKLVECIVSGAADQRTAKICAKSVICSSLVKAAMFERMQTGAEFALSVTAEPILTFIRLM